MPRKPRFYLPKVPVHVVQRGNNRQNIFFNEPDYTEYLSWLKKASELYGCRVHAYVLMPNHVHLLITPDKKESISRMMQYLGTGYVPYINHQYGRSGTLWEGRYKGCLVQNERYLLACMRYIETNPVRANMVKSPYEYRWSSYRTNGSGRNSELIVPHKRYLALGKDDRSCRSAYRALFRNDLDENMLDEIRSAWQTGTPLGNDNFKKQIERTLRTKVGYAKRGRPRKRT